MIHILNAGTTLCDIRTPPSTWPPGDLWVPIKDCEKANCLACLGTLAIYRQEHAGFLRQAAKYDAKWNKHGQAYPHGGGCEGCRDDGVCNVCGRDGRHCTNGRCRECHDGVCTLGGSTFPGHGYGDPVKAAEMAKKAKVS